MKTIILPMNDMGQSGPKRRRQAGGQTPQRRDPTRRATGAASVAGAATGSGSTHSGSSAAPAAGPLESSAEGSVAGRAFPMKRAFTIPSDFNASRDVQHRIMQDVTSCGFDEETTFAIRISLEEAIVNAIRHGNRLDPTKQVRVESNVSPGRCEIVVEDEGIGFERKRIPDPTSAENLCRPNGRGILLIESYMTNVRWERGGRRVWMVKEAAPVAPAAR